MAVKRCIPTSFFKNPDIVSLCKDTQLVLVGLVLSGDDEGRGVADARLLGREIDYLPEQVETALLELKDAELIILYQVGRRRYYQIVEDWQKSMGTKRTPSKLPAPPDLPVETPDLPAETPDLPVETLPQYNLIKYNLIEVKRNEDEAEGEALPQNVTPFPGNGGGGGGEDDKKVEQVIREVASILRLPVTDALRRVVADFLPDATLTLPGQADLAREFIENPTRNRRRKTMTPGFYRQWLQREQKNPISSKSPPEKSQLASHATGTDGTTRSGLAARSLMHLGMEYQREASSGTREKGG